MDISDWSVTLESFRCKGNLLHGWGKLKGRGDIPCAVWLKSGVTSSKVGRGLRALLTNANNPAQDKTSIDFVVYGIRPDHESTPLYLLLEWKDGRQQRLQVPSPRQTLVRRGIARLAALPWKHYFSRCWRLVRQKQTGLLIRKLMSMTAALLTYGWHPLRLLKWASREGKPLALVIDHDLGGGANQYRRTHIASLLAEGYVPVLLSTHNGLLSYVFTVTQGRRSHTAYVDDLNVLFAQLANADFRHIVFNNILSFPDPLAFVIEFTQWLKQVSPEHFLFLVHDHYCICPVWLLLDHTGKYCGIPDVSACEHCLRNNTAQFLELAAGADIVTWRTAWRALLDYANEVRCFSETTRQLVIRAYPHLFSGRINVVPHRVEHAAFRTIMLKDSGCPVVGILGHLSFYKGGEVVQALAEYIQETGSTARIVVVGTIDYPLPSSVVTITGTYLPDQLPDLLENHGVNVGFFPSICPETFSYVAEEMMMMGLPLVTFDIGAPSERAAHYARGQVIPLGDDPPIVLAAIESLYRTHIQPRP